jgi:methionyl-tRNA synthetase
MGLKDWDISRDYPYFGFKIPGEYKKFFYVWLDAPIGYMSSFLNFLLNDNLIYLFDFSKIKNFDMHHFIGKDIIYFHALFWPAVLKGTNCKLFKDLHVHGFLTINSAKMSKSTNTFIHAKSIASQVEIDFLRFYLASRLSLNVSDIDFNFLDFSNKINSDLVGKLFNIFSRCSKIIINNYNSCMADNLDNPFLFDEYLNIKNILYPFYYSCDYNKVVFYILKYADKINIYLDNEKPWILIKNSKTSSKAHNVCTTGINLFLILLLNLKPIIPNLLKKIEIILNLKDLSLDKFTFPILSSCIKPHKHIITRINIVD